MCIAVARTGSLAVQGAAGLAPGEVVDDGELAAPEDGGTVGHGQHAGVDEACQRRRPRLARPNGSLRPVAAVQVLPVEVEDRQARSAEPVQVLHGAQASGGG